MRLHAPKRGYAATILDCGVLPASYRPPVMPPPRLTRAALAATPVYGSPEPPSMAGAQLYWMLNAAPVGLSEGLAT
jgi:hypothetical protein